MVMIAVFLALLLAFSRADTMPTGVTLQQAYLMCDNSEVAVLGCAAHFLDLNHDGNITRTECTAGLAQMTLPSVNITTDYIFQGCDTDGDDVLTMADWVHPNCTCLPTTGAKRIACLTCASNGFDMRTMMDKRRFFDSNSHRYTDGMPVLNATTNETIPVTREMLEERERQREKVNKEVKSKPKPKPKQ